MIEIGKIVNTFGIKGEIKIYPLIDNLSDVKKFYVDEEQLEIEKIRFQKGIAIVKLKGLDDINLVEKYKGKICKVNESEAPKLPDGTYYIKDLIGIEVVTDEGKTLGKLDEVITTAANDVYRVGEILLPATKEVIKNIDLDNGKMLVHIIKGLI